MKLPLDRRAAAAIARLRAAGYEAWAVGGCVRDLLRGVSPSDYDLTTAARPEETERVFAGERILETGLRHGTVTVILEGLPLEITTYRVDGTYTDGRRPDTVAFTADFWKDAARRDFTINAMAYAPEQGLRDAFGGEADLAAGIIRAVGEPEKRFREDALRILRAARFASVLDFTIEPGTLQAARDGARLQEKVARERLNAELSKLLCGRAAGRVLEECPEVLCGVIPELTPLVGFDQKNKHHCYDVYTHTAKVVAGVPPKLSLRLSALLHDIGKPETFALGEDGQGHFYGHAAASARLAEAVLTRLRFPKRVTEETVKLVKYHGLRLTPEPRVLRRWLRRLGPETLLDLLALQQADAAALAPAYCTKEGEPTTLSLAVKAILAEKPCLTTRDLSVNGRDLLALGFRGKAVGAALEALLIQVSEGALPNEKNLLLQWLCQKVANNAGEIGGK